MAKEDSFVKNPPEKADRSCGLSFNCNILK